MHTESQRASTDNHEPGTQSVNPDLQQAGNDTLRPEQSDGQTAAQEDSGSQSLGRVKRAARELGYVAKALQYCRNVLDGTIPACKWVKLACQRQLDDLSNPAVFPYVFDVAKAERVCFFIEQMPHIEGPKADTKIVLEPWQCFILTTVFGWVHEFDDPAQGIKAGKRRFRRSYAEMPRGNGKSTLSAGVLSYMAFVDGEAGAQVYSIATSVEQAQAVYRPCKLMIGKCDEFREKFGVTIASHRIVQERSNSFIRALPFKPGGLDSFNIHLAVVDELHAHRTREVYEVLESGLGKRDQSLIWTITTAGFDQAGICFEKHTYVQNILEHKAEDETFFGVIYTIDDEDDPFDSKVWPKANPNSNVSVSPNYIASQAAQAMQLAAKQNEFVTKHLCQWVNADSQWMNMIKWRACICSEKVDDLAAEECILGLDLSSRLDILALSKLYRVAKEVTKKDEEGQECTDTEFHFYAFGTYWLPEETINASDNSQYAGWVRSGYLEESPGATNNYDLVEDHIMEFADTTNIKEIAHDPWQAHQTVVHLQERFGEDAVLEIPPHVKEFSTAMKELEALVVEGRFNHDGNPVLTWAIDNVVCHRDQKGNIYPRKSGDKNKIDPVIALLMALYRWTAYEEDQEPTISFM